MLNSRTTYICFFINSQSTFLINISRITERKRKTEIPHEVHEISPHNGIMPILTFLANDVTLVTSYGYCQSLKINDIREHVKHETNVRRLSYDL